MKRFERISATMVIVTTLLWLCQPAPAIAARSDWREITVGGLHIYSTLRDSRTREIAHELQIFAKIAGEVIRGPDPVPDTPTLVYVLDADDFNRYVADRPGIGGFFLEHLSDNVMVVNGDMPFEDTKQALLHEYTHYIQRNTQSVRMPPWYVEGFAELISSATLKDNVVTIGQAPHGLHIDLHDWIPVERILAVSPSDPEYRAERLMPQFYGEAWALVHYLLFDGAELWAPTARYLDSIDLGAVEPEAFANSFTFDKKQLNSAVRKLVEGRVINLKRIAVSGPITADDAPIRHLTVAEADAEFVRTLFNINPENKALGRLSAEALKESPTDLAVRALAVRIAARRHEPIDVADLVLSLPGDVEGTAQVRIDIAAALLTDAGTNESQLRSAMEILQPVIALEHPPIAAVWHWADAKFRLKDELETAIPKLEAASRRVPHNTALLRRLASASLTIGQVDKARAYYGRIILVSRDPGERAWAQKQADAPGLSQQ